MYILNNIYKKSIDYEPLSAEIIYFGMGCFWGAEKIFWNTGGIFVTAVGYSAGNTKNPTYKDICYGDTYHAEVVKIVYNPHEIDTFQLLKIFWEGHNPTQGMRQGNDIGTQYRSIIITTNEKQFELAKITKNKYEKLLLNSGFSNITTEIQKFKNFYFAEEYHQQYLLKNPNGYCGIGGCNVRYDN